MANGEPFDQDDPTTTASNLFPLGTWLKVTNPANGRSVVVQVRDRGAFSHALDLSRAAFAAIADPELMVIRVRYEVVSGPDAAEGPGAEPAPAKPAPAAEPAPPSRTTAGRHVVEPGETLHAIARHYDLSVEDLARWNGIDDPDLIRPGQVLLLGRWYEVQPGDTLGAIAARFGTSTATLLALNDLPDPDLLRPGDELRVE